MILTMDTILYFYQYLIFFYTFTITIAYILLTVLGYLNIAKRKSLYTENEDMLLNDFPEAAPGISIVAGAYNEEAVIVDCVNSFLGLKYPNFEVVIANDGSTDKTLELLIQNFELVEVPFPYIERVRCQRVQRVFRSANPIYERLTVVDKVNGGTKADAMNAGVNVAKYDYFINTDVDCILDPNTLARMIAPVLNSHKRVIAVGATMRIVNGCDLDKGVMQRVRPPRRLFPIFQETEYLRSYLVAKMGWSSLNAIPNVSGGFGLFDKSVVISAGGYDPASQAEDMDMTLRMIAFMRDNKEDYLIKQIPDTCSWTEAPYNLRLFYRQRTRWGRGFMQIFTVHHKFLFNPRYGRLGLLIMPYAFFFDLIAPVLEIIGGIFLVYLLLTNSVNMNTFWLMTLFVYLLGVGVSFIAITSDLAYRKLYKKYYEYGKLLLFAMLEAFLYQPFNAIFTIIGYVQFLTGGDFKWKNMRQGATSEVDQPEIIGNIH